MRVSLLRDVSGAFTRNVFALLDAEWSMLDRSREVVRTVTGWLARGGVLEPGLAPDSLSELHGVLRARERSQGREFTDRWLSVLLRQAQSGSEGAALAARVAMQVMLPHAVQTACRLMGRVDERTDVAQVVVACLWQAVVRYPLAQRPQRLTANLAMDTVHLATRELHRERPSGDCEVDEELAADVSASPAWQAEETWLARSAARLLLPGGVDDRSRELLGFLVWAVDHGVVTAAAAAELMRLVEEQNQARRLRRPGVRETPRVRKARSRTVRRLREAAPLFLAQAA